MDDLGIVVEFPAAARNIQTGLVTQHSSYLMDKDGSFPGDKAADP
jgi:hypothetical protein